MFEQFQVWQQAVFHYGGLMLLHATILALVTWLLTLTVFRKTRPAFRAALWIIVLTKFLIPPILPGDIALSSWVSRIGNPLRINQPSSEPLPFRMSSGEQPLMNQPEGDPLIEVNSSGTLIFWGLLEFRTPAWRPIGLHL